MGEIRKSKTITDPKAIQELISIKEEDITTSFIMENFGEFDGKVKYNPYDLITIPANSYGSEKKKNKEPFVTGVGIWVFNKYFIEKDFFDIFGYINKPVDKGVFGSINEKLSYALLENRITTEQMKRYLMKTQKYMPYVSMISPGFTEKMLTCTTVINKKKEELYKKYKDRLEKGDEIAGDEMDKELLKFATDYMKDDPSMDIFLSGAAGSLGNNFKNMFCMKGVVANPDPNAKQKYHIATSNYVDGIKPEEFSVFANSLAAGPYKRSNKTAVGGYLEKLALVALQHIVLDPPDSDCGTKNHIEVVLNKKNIKEWMYCYMKEGQKLVELTSENKDKYIGKKVKMRYASMCESKTGICSKCMGTLFYRCGRRNVGVMTTTIFSTLKNASMKSFHDSTQKFHEMDVDKAFGYK